LDPRTGEVMSFGLHATGFLRGEPLREAAREHFARYHRRMPFALTMVEVPSLRSHIVRESEISALHLAATAAIPFGFPAVEIDGRRFVDGGFRAGLPLWAAEELGATQVIALNVLTGPVFRLLRRVLWIKRPSAAMQVTLLEPSEPLGTLRDAVQWKSGNIRRWIEQGERDAIRIASSITM
jgi:NTE family protein